MSYSYFPQTSPSSLLPNRWILNGNIPASGVGDYSVTTLGIFTGVTLDRRNAFFTRFSSLLNNVQMHSGIVYANQQDLIDRLEGLWRFPTPWSDDYLRSGGIQVAVYQPATKILTNQAAQAASKALVDLADAISANLLAVPGGYIGWDINPPQGGQPKLSGPLQPPTPRILQLAADRPSSAEIVINNVDPQLLDAYRILKDAQLIPTNTAEKAVLILSASAVMASIKLNDAPLNKDSKVFLDTLLNPLYESEMASYGINTFNQGSLSARLGFSTNLSIVKLEASKFTWDFAFKQPGSYDSYTFEPKSYFNLGDRKIDIYIASDNANRYVPLDNEHYQYVGGNGDETISLTGQGGVPFYVSAGTGNDIIRVSSDIFKTNQTVVNILGGGGKNTYIIDVKDGWDSLPGQIHIWDFDPNNDTIMFRTDGSYAAPNIRETKRTLSESSYRVMAVWGDGTTTMQKDLSSKPHWVSKILNSNPYFFSYLYHAAEHEFAGDGMANLILDESTFDAKNPNKFFANPDVFKTDASRDVDGSINSNAQVFPDTGTNTIWSQLENANDHDFFKVHVSKGKSYVFTMENNPNMAGDGIFRTNLQLLDKFGNQVVASNLVTKSSYDRDSADTKIDFFAASDGDYFLDAGSSYSAGKYLLGATEIIRKSITSMSKNDDVFDTKSNHLAYKMTLVAGDLIELSFAYSDYTPSITINNDLGKVEPWTTEVSIYETTKTFLAQKSGDYYIDVTAPNGLLKCLTLGLSTSKKDIDGGVSTKADLSVNSDVKGSLNSQTDHDWYRINLNAGSTYQFDMKKTSSSPSLDSYLVLHDANGAQLAVNDDIDSWRNRDSQLIYTSKASGTYYLDAGSFANHSFGDFTLGFHKVGAVVL